MSAPQHSDILVYFLNQVLTACIIRFITFSPLSLDTCRLSLTSHLFPRTILSTSAEACCGRKVGKVNTQEMNQLQSVLRVVQTLKLVVDDQCREWTPRYKHISTIFYLFYIPYPVLDVVKGLLIGNVIH